MDYKKAYEQATLECLADPNGTRMDIIYKAMEIFSEDLKTECKRVKMQRNEYEQELLRANREINKLKCIIQGFNYVSTQ